MAKKECLKIMIVDDHPLVRDGLRDLICLEKDMTVVSECADHEEALRALSEKIPDLCIVDISLKKSQSGLDLVKAVGQRFPSVKCLVLSMHDENTYAPRALKAGAKGYIMKHEAGRKVIESVRKIAAGGICVSEAVSNRLVLSYAVGGAAADPVARLSDRELEVFRFIGEGKKTSEIAAGLRLSVSTVETYRANIKDKLGITSSARLARLAVEWVMADKEG